MTASILRAPIYGRGRSYSDQKIDTPCCEECPSVKLSTCAFVSATLLHTFIRFIASPPCGLLRPHSTSPITHHHRPTVCEGSGWFHEEDGSSFLGPRSFQTFLPGGQTPFRSSVENAKRDEPPFSIVLHFQSPVALDPMETGVVPCTTTSQEELIHDN